MPLVHENNFPCQSHLFLHFLYYQSSFLFKNILFIIPDKCKAFAFNFFGNTHELTRILKMGIIRNLFTQMFTHSDILLLSTN